MIDSALIAQVLKSIRDFVSAGGRYRREQMAELSQHLGDIVRLLAAVKSSIEARKIPREESYALSMTINFAEDIVDGIFPVPHLKPVFSEILPRIGVGLEQADIFIDNSHSTGKSHDYILRHPEAQEDVIFNSNPIPQVLKDIDRAVGALEAAQKALAVKAGEGSEKPKA